MKASLLAAFLLLPASALAQQAPGGPPPGRPSGASGDGRFLFVSPMGEPFRMAHGDQVWFAQADTNHDGRISRAEMRADAARFFQVLDRGHDGEIDPDDIAYYETQLLPEVRGGSLDGGRQRGGFSSDGDFAAQNSNDNPASPEPYSTDSGVSGAGRYSYLNIPEPVVTADRNFNRGVDPMEWQAAADERFTLLDRNNDGYLTLAEMPQVNMQERGGGGGGERGRHRRR